MKHVPNVLTISRIVVTPAVLLLLASGTATGRFWALVLFVFAAISDYFDGKLARTYGVGSRLGQFLDPLADKVLVLGTFAVFAWLDPETNPWWGVALIALRDAFVTGLRSWAEAHGRSIPTLYAAKVKTAVQLTYLIALQVFWLAAMMPGVLGAIGLWVVDSPIPYVAFLITVLVTVATGVMYATRMDQTTPAGP